MLKKIITFLLIGGFVISGLFGCSAAKYNVDYHGKKASFEGAKDSYKAGASVTLYYGAIATDTDYRFYVDGERLHPDYKAGKGYALTFKMPAHDISVRVVAHNSMVYEPDTEKTAELSFRSFDGGGYSYTVKIDDPSVVTFDQTKSYGERRDDTESGSPFTVYVTFFGLKPGKTQATVEARSPIMQGEDSIYDIEVAEDLSVSVTERETVEITE